jgi:hypothetical protein
MAKFYVSSGELRKIVTEKTLLSAAVKAIKIVIAENPETLIGQAIVISELGFGKLHEGDTIVNTMSIAELLSDDK